MSLLTATVSGVQVEVLVSRFQLHDRLLERSTGRMSVLDRDGSKDYRGGEPVELYDGATLIFSGYVLDGIGMAEHAPGVLRWDLPFGDSHYLADKVLVAYVAEAVTVDQAMEAIVDGWLAAEGITVGTLPTGPTITRKVFNRVPASEALNTLAEMAGWWWRIDHNKVLQARTREGFAAPFSLDGSVAKDAVVQRGNPQYRNRQYVVGGTDRTEPHTELFAGDGATRSFPLQYPLAQVPTVLVDGIEQHARIGGVESAVYEQAIDLDGSSGTRAITAADASLDFTGDITMVARVVADDWTPAAVQTLISKNYGFSNGQRRWMLQLLTGGTLQLMWSADGNVGTQHTRVSTAAVPFANGTEGWVAVTLDVNNGAAGHDVKFWTSPNGVTWTQLGATITTAGTTSLWNGTSALIAGTRQSGDGFAGQLLAAQVWNGLRNLVAGTGGTLVADLQAADFEVGDDAGDTATDSAGRLWLLEANAVVINAWAITWWWNKASHIVTQDIDGLVLGASNELQVDYVGQYPVVVITEDPAEVSTRGARDGSTGRVEAVLFDPGVETREDGVLEAVGLLRLYSNEGRTVLCKTRVAGMQPGMIAPTSLPRLKVEGDLLVQEVEVRPVRSAWLEYHLTLVEGPATESWVAFFRRLSTRALADATQSAEAEILLTLEAVAEAWEWTEDIDTDVWACPVPAADLYPSDTLYPC